MAMINGVIFMNKETFVYALKLVHDVLHKVTRPANKFEREYIIALIQGYLGIIANFDDEIYQALYGFLASHIEFNEAEVELLYSYIADDVDILN